MSKTLKENTFWINVVIIVIGLGMLYPVLWLLSASFKEANTIFSDPGLIPRPFTLQNYVKGWQGIGIVGFGTFFKNSFVISGLCVIANVLFCSITAYAFARLEFKRSRPRSCCRSKNSSSPDSTLGVLGKRVSNKEKPGSY